jgi:hypothetical protein
MGLLYILPFYLRNRRLGEPQSRSVPFGGEKNVLTVPGLESRIVQVAILRYSIHMGYIYYYYYYYYHHHHYHRRQQQQQRDQ